MSTADPLVKMQLTHTALLSMGTHPPILDYLPRAGIGPRLLTSGPGGLIAFPVPGEFFLFLAQI
jgi:hypothetical protein